MRLKRIKYGFRLKLKIFHACNLFINVFQLTKKITLVIRANISFSVNCAIYNADVISGNAHIVAFVHVSGDDVDGGSVLSANNTSSELCTTRV